MIEKVGLYNIIFTPHGTNLASTSRLNTKSTDRLSSLSPVENISRLQDNLLEAKDFSNFWLLFALTPWAKVSSADPEMPKRKVRTAAGAVARNGLKAPNDVSKVVDNAALLVDEIQALVAEAADNSHHVNAQNGQSGHVQDQPKLRLRYGKAIRRWGEQWRLCVLYAMFVQLFENDPACEYPSLRLCYC